MEKLKFDIVIVGAGIVGAALACALASRENTKGLAVALIEPGEQPKQFSGNIVDPRVVALTRNSQKLLTDDIGVWSAIEAGRLCPYQDMHVWDGEGTAAIDFSSAEVKQKNLGHIVENSLLLNCLLEKLDSNDNIKIFRGVKLESIEIEESDLHSSASNPRPSIGGVKSLLSNQQALSSDLVIAADGGQSKVRKLLSMATREWAYGQQAIVTTVKTQHSHEFSAWQRFMTSGPLAFLPLQIERGDGHHCSIVWSLADSQVSALMAMNDDDFAERLGECFEYRLGKIETVAKRYAFPLVQRHAVDYVVPGVALLGDAAHTIHPLAGQGVNLGLEDVSALVREIERGVSRELPLNDFSILKRYQRERKGENLKMMAVMEGFKHLFSSVNPVVSTSRNIGMSSINRMPVLKNALVKLALGL